MIGLLLLAGFVNAVVTDWRGQGFLGIALVIGGSVWAVRGAILEVAGFRSSGSVAPAAVGVIAIAGGGAIVLRGGLGWIGLFVIVGTMLFANHSGFTRARYMRRRRALQLESVTT